MVTLTIGDFTLKAELAVTKEQLITGLSNRDSLPCNEGLLLILPQEGRIPITMKDMRFPIDVLFFDSFFKVIDVKDLWEGEIFIPSFSWQFALETNGIPYIPTNEFARISDGPSSSSSSSLPVHAPYQP